MAVTDKLAVGDFLPEFALPNQRRGTTRLSRQLRGKAAVLLFYPDQHLPACQKLLRGFAELYPRLDALAHVFIVNRELTDANARAANLHALPFEFMLSDPEGQVAGLYEVEHNLPQVHDVTESNAFTCIVAGPNGRILQIARNVRDAGHAAATLALLEALADEEPREIRPYAPVLYVPDVLGPDLCRHFMELFETRGSQPTGVTRSIGNRLGTEVLDDQTKIRSDHIVEDEATHHQINRYVGRRVLPEIFKAFGYQVTHVEVYKIACYDGSHGGFFRPHRDNMSKKNRHRRFAMTLNLNTGEYTGGQLRFPEYGPHLYAPGAGDAVVFSCSLLHEVVPVTAGQRFALLGFFYGAEGEQMLKRQASDQGRAG